MLFRCLKKHHHHLKDERKITQTCKQHNNKGLR